MSTKKSKKQRPPTSRFERLAKGIQEDPSSWAQELDKSSKQVKRYMRSGIIPDAYKDEQGRWRAPLTDAALCAAEQRLKGFKRKKKLPRKKPEIDRGRNAAVAYGLYLAMSGKQLKDEYKLHRFVEREVTADSGELLPDRETTADEKARWDAAQITLKERGFKLCSLIAAFALAINDEGDHKSLEEQREYFTEAELRVFGSVSKGAQEIPKKRKSKNGNESGEDIRLNETKALPKRPVRPCTVIKYWQWLTQRRPIKNQKSRIVHRKGKPSYVYVPTKYLTRATFYNWCKDGNRNQAYELAKITASVTLGYSLEDYPRDGKEADL